MYYSFKRSLRTMLLIGSLSSGWMACSDDDPVKDTTLPLITITTPSSDNYVKGIVSVKATVEENNFAKAEVYVDNTLLGEVTTTDIDLSWDSKTVTDGSHSIKIVATDKQGNKGEVSAAIDVLNTVFSLTIPENYISQTQNLWIFISDAKGNVLGAKEATNNTEIKFNTPDDFKKGDVITFNRLTYSLSGNGTTENYNLASYTDLKPGVYSYVTATPSSSRASIGNATLQISNSKFAFVPNFVGEDIGSVTGGGNSTLATYNVPLYKNNTDFYFMYRNSLDPDETPGYKKITNVSVGDIASFDINELTPLDKEEISLPDNITQINTSIYGYKQAGSYTKEQYVNNYTKSSGDYSSLNIYFPGSEYPEYRTNMTIGTGEKTFSYTKIGAIPTSFKTLNGSISNFQFENSVLKATATGNYDMAFFEILLFLSDGNYSWSFNTSDPSKAPVLPKIPSEIIEKYQKLNNFPTNFTAYGIRDYDQINGYDEVIKYIFQDNTNPLVSRYKELTSITIPIQGTNGRGKTQTVVDSY